MPRKARIDAPGVLNHVIFRGIEWRKIFRSDFDRSNFLERLGDLVPATSIDCFGWAMLDNHVHLLLRTGAVPISIFMSRLLMGYAGWFDRKYKRHGQLFQNRYKSIRRKEARKKYREFVSNGLSEGKRPDLTGGGLLRSIGGWTGLKRFRKAGIRAKGDERILGDSDLVATVLVSAKEALEEKYLMKARGIDFEQVVQRVANVMKLTPDQVTAYGKSPQTVQARSLLCFWAHRKLGMTTIEIAKRLGISQPAASRCSKRGEQIEKENRYELIGRKSIKAWTSPIYPNIPHRRNIKRMDLFKWDHDIGIVIRKGNIYEHIYSGAWSLARGVVLE